MGLPRLPSALRRFLRHTTATTAIEFAVLAPAFLALIIAILQTAIFLFIQEALQDAAMQAGRLFMTGNAQSMSQTAFKNQICTTYLPTSIFNCNALIVVVQTYADFASSNTTAPALYNNGQPVTSFPYNPGSPGQVMVVQLVYPWTVVGGLLGYALSNLPNGAAEMMGMTAFRVEPY